MSYNPQVVGSNPTSPVRWRGRLVWLEQRNHNPKVGSSNLPLAITIDFHSSPTEIGDSVSE